MEKVKLAENEIVVTATTADHIESFHMALDEVARERRYLAMLEAFPLAETREFALNMIKQGNPHVVAMSNGRVVGWCDISRHFFPSHSHRGSLGMGIIPDYRGRGLGARLIATALEQARKANLVRVEFSVRADNARAIALYKKVGFLTEGVQKRGVFVDGRFIDTINMAMILDED